MLQDLAWCDSNPTLCATVADALAGGCARRSSWTRPPSWLDLRQNLQFYDQRMLAWETVRIGERDYYKTSLKTGLLLSTTAEAKCEGGATVSATIELLQQGVTVPFYAARYKSGHSHHVSLPGTNGTSAIPGSYYLLLNTEY